MKSSYLITGSRYHVEYTVPHQIHNLGLNRSELIVLIVLFKLRMMNLANRFVAMDSEVCELAKVGPHTVRKVKRVLRARGIINWWVENKRTKYTLPVGEEAI